MSENRPILCIAKSVAMCEQHCWRRDLQRMIFAWLIWAKTMMFSLILMTKQLQLRFQTMMCGFAGVFRLLTWSCMLTYQYNCIHCMRGFHWSYKSLLIYLYMTVHSPLFMLNWVHQSSLYHTSSSYLTSTCWPMPQNKWICKSTSNRNTIKGFLLQNHFLASL